jgi:O-antigen/teichoic acid export membrane protein
MVAFARRFGKRLAIMVGGEAMQSGLHFLFNLWLLRRLPAAEYGVFALVMIMGGVALIYIRALAAMPASVRIGRSRGRGAASVHEVTFGTAATLIAALIALIVGLILRGGLHAGGIAGGAFVGAWALRGHVRTAVFARGDPTPVAIGDATFGCIGVAGFAGLVMFGGGPPRTAVFLLLAGANVLGIAALLIAARRRPRLSLRRTVRRRYTALWRQLAWSGGGVTLTNLQGQGVVLVVSAMAGPAAYAPIAAILVMFTPLRIIAAAIANMMQPDLSPHVARGERAVVWRQAVIWTLILACGSLIYGAAVLAGLPFLRAKAFAATSLPVLGALAWATATASMGYVMPRIVLEATGSLRGLALVTGISGVIGMMSVAAILTVAPSAWSLLGMLASEMCVLVGFWWLLARRFAIVPARFGGGQVGLAPPWPARDATRLGGLQR